MSDRFPIIFAVLAAVLFGMSTPLAKLLLANTSPLVLAGLLYAGSGIGLGIWLLGRALIKRTDAAHAPAWLNRHDAPWLAGAVLAGGVAAPLLLMLGISHTSASSAALLLNLEGVLTALMAWFIFKENFDRRIFAGMALIVMGSAVLTWDETILTGSTLPLGALLVSAACLCWAIDNNLTRKISAADPVQIATIKGLAAGAINLTVAVASGVTFPSFPYIAAAGAVGLAGYGISLVLFVLALRYLGTARTGAYFSIAPFAGAALSFLLLADTPGPLFWLAVAFMLAGVWLHLTERHEHEHTHEETEHSHAHRHDAHHQHEHDFTWDGTEPHTHPHTHEPITHTHAHYPDIHHRHGHA